MRCIPRATGGEKEMKRELISVLVICWLCTIGPLFVMSWFSIEMFNIEVGPVHAARRSWCIIYPCREATRFLFSSVVVPFPSTPSGLSLNPIERCALSTSSHCHLRLRKMVDETTSLITPPPGDEFLSPDVDGVWTKPDEEKFDLNWGFFLIALLGKIYHVYHGDNIVTNLTRSIHRLLWWLLRHIDTWRDCI